MSQKRVWYNQDSTYARRLEAERIRLTGPDLEYYSLVRGGNVDIVYNEPDNDPLYGGDGNYGDDQSSSDSWVFYPDVDGGDDAIVMQAAVLHQEMDDRNPVAREEGSKHDYDAQIYIARNHWECAVEETNLAGRKPKFGDVVYVWDQWWDVVKAGRGGYICDSPDTVGFRLDLKIRTEFTPDRKV